MIIIIITIIIIHFVLLLLFFFILRMAACKNRESSVNGHFGGQVIFCPKIPFSELFSKTTFKSSSDQATVKS